MIWEPLQLLWVGGAAVAAGLVNALAGGGTLITFPMLTAVGVPVVAANVTNTVALCPGYLGATFAQMKDLKGQGRRVWVIVPAAVLGGVVGGVLLLNTGERIFRSLVPFLILLASVLLAIQDPVKRWVTRRQGGAGKVARTEALPGALPEALPEALPGALPEALPEALLFFPLFCAAVYGGYFGAGLSVIVLSALGLLLNDSLTRLNALKQLTAFATNIAAALFFLFSGQVEWTAAGVMAAGALLGGALGGKLAGKIAPSVLRWIVVTVGIGVSIVYFVR